MKTIEYRIRPVTRYLVTRFESDDNTRSAQVETFGDFDSEIHAIRVKNALERHDPDAEALPPHACP